MSPRPPEPPDFPASQLFLRRLAFHLVRDEARAEDLVQDTWAAWVEHRPSGVVEPRAWLAKVLRNRALNAKRGDARRAQREELAGRPDPSDPETEGTLEAQAQLLESLRKLEEPYRSTLVQRYYHDLAPKEIAERTGTPLNTVKARLARGLEKLRGTMDRRYHGDRKAWCHWLTVLGGPPLVPLPPAAGPAAAAGSSALAWTGVCLVLVAGAAAKALWPVDPRGPGTSPPALTTWTDGGESTPVLVPEQPTQGTSEPPAVDAAGERSGRLEGKAPTKPAPVAPSRSKKPAVPPPFLAPFDWPQFAGGPRHDTYRRRQDGIQRPQVKWFVPLLSGPPSLLGGELYSGGVLLVRVDLRSGALLRSDLPSLERLEDLLKSHDGLLEDAARSAGTGEDLESFDPLWGGAPVVTPGAVIVRSLVDGAVVAYDRALENLLWRFEVEGGKDDRPGYAQVPLCLAEDGTLIVVADRQVIALHVSDGGELWHFSCNGTIRMVPVCAGGRVFFGMDRGQFYALEQATGRMLWTASGGNFSSDTPVLVGNRLIVVDRGDLPWRTPHRGPRTDPESTGILHVHDYDARSGTEVWQLGVKGSSLSALGLAAEGEAGFVGTLGKLGRIDLRAGQLSTPVLQTKDSVVGTPAVVGDSLVFACADGLLYVHDLESLELLWSFRAPDGARIEDFVHSGDQIYVATSIGLFCLGNDPIGAAPAPGFVLEWEGDTKKALIDFGR